MATRLKTVTFAFPQLAALTELVVTNLTQITLYLPESSKTFRKVTVTWSGDDIITATGGTINEYRTGLRLAAVAYSTVTNTNDITHSAENSSFQFTADFTSYFTTNWSGTSMTCDLQVYMDQTTGTTANFANVCATIEITYEYDDTSTTQVKTVMIPLDAPVGALATTEPGGAIATIPALDTWLPEPSKTYRNMFIVVQGNEHRNAAVTDHTISLRIDATATHTTGNYEGALASDRWFRYVWDCQSLITTNATNAFRIWASVARCNHLQIYMVVTYEFATSAAAAWAASTAYSLGDRVYGSNDIVFRCTTAGTSGGTEPAWTTTQDGTTNDNTAVWTVEYVRNSVQLPMNFDSPMGGTTSSDYQRATRDLWIEEPGTISDEYCALLAFWDQAAAIAGLNMRVGTGSFVAYTDTAANLSGGNGAMIRNDAGVTLARGKNTISADVYRTDTADLGWNMSGLWLINYLSALHKDGHGAHNHTVKWNLANMSTVAASTTLAIAATAPVIPETNYFINAVGAEYRYLSNSTTTPAGVSIQVERLSAEGGVQWENVYSEPSHTDPESGIRSCYSQARLLFQRWHIGSQTDEDTTRFDLETARRWRIALGNAATAFHTLNLIFTYHSITFEVAGDIADSNGGTVTVALHRAESGEKVLETSRVGDGAYSFTWFDNTADVYVAAYEAAGYAGRSDDGAAV